MTHRAVSGSPLRNESLYLLYRRFFPIDRATDLHPVATAEEMRSYIAGRFAETEGRIGIMLSGGMDSALLASFLPKGSIAYTLDYNKVADRFHEFDLAAEFVPEGIEHKKVTVTSDAYHEMCRKLTHLKKAPTVPHDPSVGITAEAAVKDGITHMVTGAGADGHFAGFAHLYKDPSFAGVRDTLAKQFVLPSKVLKDPAPTDWVLGHFSIDGIVDVRTFLEEIGTEGTAVRDTMIACGLVPLFPLTEMIYTGPYEITRRGGKHPIVDLFKLIYDGRRPNPKLALPVPYGPFMRNYTPRRPEFLPEGVAALTAKQQYQIYALELYMDMRDEFGWEAPSADRLFV
ncbi:MAG: asparagine synthase-related protein [Paracoccaceae bacterium]|jgi:hypothetical protein